MKNAYKTREDIAVARETALQLERVVGNPADFWINLERNYCLRLAEAEPENICLHKALL